MKNIKIGTTGKTYKRNGDFWSEFIVTNLDNNSFSMKITKGEEKGKYSFLYFHELDDTIKFNK